MVSILWAVYLVTAVTVDCRNLNGLNSQDTSIYKLTEDFGIEDAYQMYLVDDMALNGEQWSALKQRKAIKDTTKRWSEDGNGYPQVPYDFQTHDPYGCTSGTFKQSDCSIEGIRNYCRILCNNGFTAFPATLQPLVKKAIEHWMNHTCIKFVNITSEPTSMKKKPHLIFDSATNCSSSVGMSILWGQVISTVGCSNDKGFGSIVHEIGHAIGFWHEQMRSDRDQFIYILNNLETTQNYKIKTTMNYKIDYDYSSVMHYDGRGMVAKEPLYQEVLGTSLYTTMGLSHRDRLLANKMYGCIDKWKALCPRLNDVDPCLNDGYTKYDAIAKDCTCVCPPGWADLLCDKFVEEYYAHLKNPSSENITSMMSIKVQTPIKENIVSYDGPKFVKWIVPSTCKTAKVIFKSSNLNTGSEHLNIRTISSDLIGTIWDDACLKTGPTLESNTGIIITTKYEQNTQKTLWEADVTFENIPGCSVSAPVQPKVGCSIFFRLGGWTGSLSGNLDFSFSGPVTVSSWRLELLFDIHLTNFETMAVNIVGATYGRKITLESHNSWFVHIADGDTIIWWIKMEFVGTQEPQIISARLISPDYPCGVQLC